MKQVLVCILVLFYTGISKAQYEAQKWCFGHKAGLDFSTEPPSLLTNSVVNAAHSQTSISDRMGTLLFYTNGQTVWNQQHTIMANGTGLSSGIGALSQTGLVVKQPGTNHMYYIFNNSGSQVGGYLTYSIVDMSLAAGMGSVTIKNDTLMNSSCNKITATRHCNGQDAWILVHERANDKFHAFLLTSSGINTVSVVSQVGPFYGSAYSYVWGYHKFSPQGKKLIASVSSSSVTSSFELYDFDNATGVVSNPITLGNFYGTNSCEFSSDGSKAYGIINNNQTVFSQHILQWDLCVGSPTAIVASTDTIGVLTGTNSALVGLQLATNGKIYAGRGAAQVIGVIHQPNTVGPAANYVDLGQSIGTGTCTGNLPNFETSLLKAPFSFSAQALCPVVSFSVPSYPACSGLGYTVSAYAWNFGDPSSGAANTSTLAQPLHTYGSAGSYTTQLIVYYSSCAPDTIVRTVTVNQTPAISLLGKQSICAKETTTLSVNGANSYSWNTGATSATLALSPTVTTVYTVTGTFTNATCQSVKVITVSVLPCTGVNEIEKADEVINVFPNPGSGLYLITTEDQSLMRVKVYNPFGVLIVDSKTPASSHSIDIQNYPAGIYHAEVTVLNGKEKKRNFKLIKN